MGCTLKLSGYLSVGSEGCGGCGDDSGSSSSMRGLAIDCSSSSFAAIKATECHVPISTAGTIGQAWVELPVQLTAYQLLSLAVQGTLRVRIGAAPATKLGSSGVFPATTMNGQTFGVSLDGVAVAATFAGASLTAQQLANQINAAAAGAGLDYLPASVDSSGQLRLTGKATGAQGSVQVTAGQAAIGLPTSAAVLGEGKDLDVLGPMLVQFAAPYPSRVQISGQAKVAVLAAGTP